MDKKTLDLTNIIKTVIQVPGVRVSREEFLQEQFKNYPVEKLNNIINVGPINAGCTRDELLKKAYRILKERSAIATSLSFVTGLPGGVAMAATIPTDIFQFYGVALRMAQELVYLYGETDIWCDGTPDATKVTNQLILYCGVMLGANGAAQAVRLMTSNFAKQLAKTLPQKALSKGFIYPVIKSTLKYFGIHISKKVFAKGVSNTVMVVGGVVSGGITLASMLPMGNRLIKVLDKAHFDYTVEDIEEDIAVITDIYEEAEETENAEIEVEESVTHTETETLQDTSSDHKTSIVSQIQEAKQLLDSGIITEDEFSEIKKKLIAQL